MSVNTRVEVAGINEAIRALNKIEPGLRKKFQAEAQQIAQPAVSEAQRRYSQVGWGSNQVHGISRNWSGQAVKGRKAFPWSVSKATRGVKVKLDSDRRRVASILLTQTDFATAILEAAGRKNQNPLADALGDSLKPTTTRVLGKALYSRKKQVEEEMKKAAFKVVDMVNKELN
jgi:hypothetical protein